MHMRMLLLDLQATTGSRRARHIVAAPCRLLSTLAPSVARPPVPVCCSALSRSGPGANPSGSRQAVTTHGSLDRHLFRGPQERQGTWATAPGQAGGRPSPTPSRLGASKAKGMDSEMRFSKEDLVGSAFMAFGITLLVGFFYAAVLSKLLPPYENQLLAAIQNDWYYCLLMPLTLLMLSICIGLA